MKLKFGRRYAHGAGLHDQFPEEEGLTRRVGPRTPFFRVLHDQFPEEEGLKQRLELITVIDDYLHDQFPEEEGLKPDKWTGDYRHRRDFMTSFQRKKD